MPKAVDYYPRCFRYCDVPVFQGRKLLVAHGDIEYKFYLEWLVSYLDNLKYEVPDCQLELCAWASEEYSNCVAFWLGHNGFYHLLTMRDLISHVEGGSSYDEAVKFFREFYEERVKESNNDPEMVDPFETWISPFLWEEAKRESTEIKLFTNGVSYTDLGYRIPMAIAFKRMYSIKEKYEFLDSFYWTFNEEASK